MKMIFRNWSLLTVVPISLGAIVGTLVVADYVIFDKDPFVAAAERKHKEASTKLKQ